MRASLIAAVAAIGVAVGHAAVAEAPGVPASGSAGAGAPLQGPYAPGASGDNLGASGSAAGAGAADAGITGRISQEQIRQSMRAAGYTNIVVARGMLNGAAQELRIDPQTGRLKQP
jgi:hypothetical protein